MHLLGPGGVFAFLQGKYLFSVQFVDNDDGMVKKNPANNRIKSAFQNLRRSISRESLSSTLSFSPGNAKVAAGKGNDGCDNETSRDLERKSIPSLNMNEKSTTRGEESPMIGTGKKRKRTEDIEDKKTTDLPNKLRKSLSGKLMACVSTENKGEINLKDLQEEFGDAIMQEIEREKGEFQSNSVCPSIEESLYGSLPVHDIQNGRLFKVTKNTWVIEDGLMVFSGKDLESREKVQYKAIIYFKKVYCGFNAPQNCK